MAYFFYIWTPEIIAHLAEHGITPEEFEEVVNDPLATGKSRTSDRDMAVG